MKKYLILMLLALGLHAEGQELYVYSEPASNNPSRSVSAKLSAMFGKGRETERLMQRYMPELTVGLNKNWMLRASATFADMHQPGFQFESARVYGKWRFLSADELHRHFRMAAFASVTYSRNELSYNEINIAGGDQSGLQAGLILTQLWNKAAVSGTVALNEIFDGQRGKDITPDPYAYRSLSYSLSAGYLLLPRTYTDYRQTNLNLYLELLGSRNMGFPDEKYYLDLAPALQLIFNSSSKLNLGYRFQLDTDIQRMMKNSFMISFEHLFLNAWGIKRKRREG